MSLDSLIEPLDKALLVAEPSRSYDFKLFFQVIVLRDTPKDAPVEFRNLLNAIKCEPLLEIFDSAHQGWESIDFNFLLTWMISRGQEVGAIQVIQDIRKYLENDTLEITTYLLVKGFQLNSKVIIDDFTVIPWKDIPQSDTKYNLTVRKGSFHDVPTVAICSKKIINKRHLRPWDTRYSEIDDPIEPLLDLLKCMMLTKELGIQLVALWKLPPVWAPWKASESNFGQNNQQWSTHTEFDESNLENLRHLHASWLKLDKNTKQHLRLPLERLNSSILQHIRFVDSAIDLGIAFESTFLSTKEREQIGALIRLRAAKYLSNDFATRQGIVKKVKDVYSLRSSAVHRGTFENESTWRDGGKVFNALNVGRDVLRQALIKHVTNGVPNWEVVDLS